jgi:hypothetical protein
MTVFDFVCGTTLIIQGYDIISQGGDIINNHSKVSYVG